MRKGNVEKLRKRDERQRALSLEQTKFRVLIIERILNDGRKHTAEEIENILYVRYGIKVGRKTIYHDIYAIDKVMPIEVIMGCKGGFRKMVV